ncbi:DUF4389 domain-containing protein [Arthrobacter globiformis]|uniref:DUF4389 domain-containing protein n=1 Tax=Arthrobacter globiformis TaxID=1665 RepID=UPI0027D8224F|nr:DUF4389 domain-containing protein [Arthrobacter globiformis]
MAVLTVGVLLGLAAVGVLSAYRSPPWGPEGLTAALLAVGVSLLLIIVGAAGLGGGIAPGASQEADRGGNEPSELTGHLDPDLSRWLWLVKWILVIPHYIILALLWIAFLVVTVAAGFAILFTGRYPASLFQFTVGVLRWNWRVTFYAYGVLGTDHYPPFTLARSDYPAELDVAYPLKLSRWKVLFKSWLFALPQLLIVAALTGSLTSSSTASISLLSLLVCIAAVILLFTGVYRPGIFDLLMGINRWTL